VPPPPKAPGFIDVPVVFMVHCAVWMLAAKLPLLCAWAVKDPNNASAMIAMLQDVAFVMI